MNTFRSHLLIATQLCSILLMTILVAASAQAQTPTASANDNRGTSRSASAFAEQFRFSLMPAGFRLAPATSTLTNLGSRSSAISLMPMAAGPNLQVLGSGTVGRLTKWTGLTSSNSILGDTTIFEDKFGQVGIGTDTPTSRLTVAGMIETTLGGLKFPDGTVQATSAAGALFSVVHDATLIGHGSAGSPLRVAVPLVLNGAASSGNPILKVTNTDDSGFGILAQGGDSSMFAGGVGVHAEGGKSGTSRAGRGVTAVGGASDSGEGGVGVHGDGGNSTSGSAGVGVVAVGGSSFQAGGHAGDGIVVLAGFANNGAAKARAGTFTGDVQVDGTLNVTGTKNFKIDNPLDPENKYLLRAAIESSEVLNLYSGNVITDANGEAVVALPDWFEALNKDLRYQLTVVGTFAQAIVAEKVRHNRFTIKSNAPNVEISWQVTGVRSDAVMLRHPFKAEEAKPESERGTYLSPEAYRQPEERGIEWARQPEIMQRLKEQRLEAPNRKSIGKQSNP